MRPGIAALVGEIVRVGHDVAHRRLVLGHLVGDAEALAIGHRLLRGVEVQAHLLAHVARARPAHERIDLPRLFGLVVEHPLLGLGGARLHRGLAGLVDACPVSYTHLDVYKRQVLAVPDCIALRAGE